MPKWNSFLSPSLCYFDPAYWGKKIGSLLWLISWSKGKLHSFSDLSNNLIIMQSNLNKFKWHSQEGEIHTWKETDRVLIRYKNWSHKGLQRHNYICMCKIHSFSGSWSLWLNDRRMNWFLAVTIYIHIVNY